MKDLYIYRNSEYRNLFEIEYGAVEHRAVEVADDGIHDFAAQLLKDGIYEFCIIDNGKVLFNMSCYNNLFSGEFSNRTPLTEGSWSEYCNEHPEIWERYEDELSEGIVCEKDIYDDEE